MGILLFIVILCAEAGFAIWSLAGRQPRKKEKALVRFIGLLLLLLLLDTGDCRELTVKLWYPLEEGSYPLIVFSHGAFGVIDSNYSTCMELASNGYVVASIAHTYQAMFVENASGQIRVVSPQFMEQVTSNNGSSDPEHERLFYQYSLEWMQLRTADENFVLDMILAEAADGTEVPFDRINAEKIGLFGHSMGGASSVALGRQRSDIDAMARQIPGDGYVNFYPGERAVNYRNTTNFKKGTRAGGN